ncbi:MAG: TetM/TetW/TetO/TetS family tetracycline resistance ribosomal protection protein [Clostridia bacterium]|nr:TetM/TetW/TetO/TetS family tetracycline resistance ribosomal protection protein [Clostridia bacterium]
MKNLVIGILAHVDAGKTTLSEALLYSSGTTDKLGRVDKRDSFLDTYSLERERGITIFSKQAIITTPSATITLIDTPGHIDFSCEAERALSIEDYAILIINACDGVQSHTKTIWQLLRARKIPTFIFVNKTDISEKTRQELMRELRLLLSPALADFSTVENTLEDCAGADEDLMAEYFESGSICDKSITDAIYSSKLFPCFFGSALKMVGIKELLSAIDRYTKMPHYPEKLCGAKVYKITRDKNARRLSFVKVTGGTLACKDTINVRTHSGEVFSEKIEEIRVYSGEKFKSKREVAPGTVCALLGPEHTEAGGGIGFERVDETTLSPVLNYRIILPANVSPQETYPKLLSLAEEDPSLSLAFDDRTKDISIRLMGEIQLEVIRELISERLGITVSFDEGSILYKETVEDEVFGRGHFEPLRHYAEVHLLIEPLPEGSGIVTATDCSTDALAANWQRLIISHIEEKRHRGVLIGAPLTDVKITLVAGKAHIKHTEGGDFRQATYRAIRQGLMKAKSVLLEPTFNFKIELPREFLGRAMLNVEEMGGYADPPEIDGDTATLKGNCPVYTMRSYATALRAFTKGEGKLTLEIGPYRPCHNAEKIIAEKAYNPELDERNTANSVFCKNGAGYVVPWQEADEMMHLGAADSREETLLENRAVRQTKTKFESAEAEDKALMAIFEATYGKIKPRKISEKSENSSGEKKNEYKPKKEKPKGDNYLVIDGYNLIFAWDFLRSYADKDISLARDILARLACNYSSFKRCKIIIAFDAYKRHGGEGSSENLGDVSIVFTKESETADSFIEKTVHKLAQKNTVRVVTNDQHEQMMILGSGALRVSAREFALEMNAFSKEIDDVISNIK